MSKIAAAAGLSVVLLLAAPATRANEPEYRVVTDPAESARGAALEILQHLAAGELEAAAARSNAPQPRLEVLRGFQSSLGEEQFKQVFGRYLEPQNRIVLEAAIGRRRLVVWELGAADGKLAGQYYVEAEGGFLMDDVPNEERSRLQRVLEALRKQAGR